MIIHRFYADIIKELKKKIARRTIICIIMVAVALTMAALFTAEVIADADCGVCQSRIEDQKNDTPHNYKT
jgi:hypothetical protein